MLHSGRGIHQQVSPVQPDAEPGDHRRGGDGGAEANSQPYDGIWKHWTEGRRDFAQHGRLVHQNVDTKDEERH